MFPLVPTIPETGDSDVKAYVERKGSGKNGSDEDAVALHEGVVERVGEGHGFCEQVGWRSVPVQSENV